MPSYAIVCHLMPSYAMLCHVMPLFPPGHHVEEALKVVEYDDTYGRPVRYGKERLGVCAYVRTSAFACPPPPLCLCLRL